MPSSTNCADPVAMTRSACRTFVHEPTKTLTHVVWDRETSSAVVIDPVLDYDGVSGEAATTLADAVLDWLVEHALRLRWILETHVHADHVSAADYLRARAGGRIGTGVHVRQVQATVRALYDVEPDRSADGRAFDHLFEDG